ncbi:putative periplasmic lipoprotein [Campylobacter volucris]|uniref:Periplasmic lipoprotein n=1 Tax=Campylobacter volucris TaxID=1031542 RepID=A0AAF1D1L0_9BACT|nr:putative periplasmic lipoprotein [Campylobacter volucris]AJC93517.1 putative periplasmic lipoprotein (DUF1425 domain) [Campylobacter volucris LMG 24379]KAB0579235.1 putative periplasmic lipoprotein [Campylobacter volucris]QBL14091.1 putative periplasmic lipoprotein [Campylobacter volucris]QEL07730.1 putative periplasmic lipoprotein (DUF1425 domain) [Campylobacter volucris]TXK68137.1 putative periplasmic lipoprotein [Campylobacter volucris]
MKKIIILLLSFMCLFSQDVSQFKHSNVKSVKERINDVGLLEVQITFYSLVNKKISYKIEWFDKDGFAVKNTIDENYQNIRLLSGQDYIVQKVATNERIKKYKIYIK